MMAKLKQKTRLKLLDRSLIAAWSGAVALCLTTGAAVAEPAGARSVAAKGSAAKARSRHAEPPIARPTPQGVAPQNAAQQAVPASDFSAYDWDGDGNISREEWQRGPRKGGAPAAAIPASGEAEAAPASDAESAEEKAAKESDPKQLGEVTVTAQRRKESAQKVPTAITVLGGNRLTTQGIGRSASEVLNYVPNASAGTQQHGRPRWWIRGLGTGQQQLDLTNPVGFFTDEVFISNSTSTGFPLFDLERVEVLRGPQGTLWGKNTTGGAISVVSRKPTFTPSGYVKLGYGTYNEKIAEGAYGQALTDTIAARAAFYYQDQDGRFNTQDPVTNLLTGERQGGLSDAAFRVSFLDKITPDLEANFNVHYRAYNTIGGVGTQTVAPFDDAGVATNGVGYKDPLTGYQIKPSKDINVISSLRRGPITSNTVDQAGAVLNLQQKFGGYVLTSVTGYEDWSSTVKGNGPNQQDSWQFSEEVRFASPREDRWNWLTGFHYFHEQITSDTATSTLPCGNGLTTTQISGLPNGGGCLSDPARGGRQAYTKSDWDHVDESFAIFGSTTFNFTEQLLATVGVRYTHETKELNLSRTQAGASSFDATGRPLDKNGNPVNTSYNSHRPSDTGVIGDGPLTSNPLFYDPNNWWQSVNPAYLPDQVTLNPANLAARGNATSFNGKLQTSWDLLTYDVTPEFKITDNALVYFKHARGAKSGGFNTGATQLAVLNTIIKPETLMSYEIGAKTGWFEGRLKANANLFYYDYANNQLNITAVPDPNFPGNRTGYIYNVKSSHSQGAELELEALPIPELHLWGNLGFLDTRFDDVSNIDQGTVTDPRTLIKEGNDFVRSPHLTAFLQADYRIPYELPLRTHLTVSGDWRYQDKQYYYVNYQDNSPLSSQTWQKPYSLVNFRLTLASHDDKYNLIGFINNALDEKYLNHTNTPGNIPNTSTSTWGQPRTFGVQAVLRF